MRLIKANATIIDTEGLALEQVIERAGRCCYKSESKITSESAPTFCKMLIGRGHESVLEHANIPLIVSSLIYRRLSEWPHSGRGHTDGGPYPVHRPLLRATQIADRCMISGNVRAWRDALRMSWSLYDVESVLRRSWPTLFGDLEEGRPASRSPRNVAYAPNEHLVASQQLTEEEVLTHRTVMVKFVIDRGVSHELVRHRHDIAFSQESTRYCDYGGAGVSFIIPPWCAELIEGEHTEQPFIRDDATKRWYYSLMNAEADYVVLRTKGWKPEQARSVLPNSLKTELVVTAALREWSHIFRMRCAEVAHPQMREVMLPLRDEFKQKGYWDEQHIHQY